MTGGRTETASAFEDVPPSAAAMIESMRAYGYSPGTAIADVIDNSISAGARNVWLRFAWAGSDSCVSIADDGIGMNEDELRAAMRLGSRSPLEPRRENDLGRFGLGLKTASFSQCRRLTVASRKNGGAIAVRCWDLDHIAASRADRWELKTSAHTRSEPHLRQLESMPSGTIVLWEVLDRLSGGSRTGDERHKDSFFRTAGLVRQHLGVVFHRYVEGPSPRLTIHTGGDQITGVVCPWDPFMDGHPATREEPSETMMTATGRFEVTGFVLPHKDRLTDKDYEAGAGIHGWTAQQGFYVYRNERLLVPGSWLGLGTPRPWTMQAHHSLARIRIDLPNSLDGDWQIDVRKSIARVPSEARDRLMELAEIIRNKAHSVFAHRAQYGARPRAQDVVRAWTARQGADGRATYRVNRQHPTVHAVLTGEFSGKDAIEQLLRTLEETVPVRQIWLDTADREGEQLRPFEHVADQHVRDLMQEMYRLYREVKGLDPAEAVRQVMLHEEFQDYAGIAATLDG